MPFLATDANVTQMRGTSTSSPTWRLQPSIQICVAKTEKETHHSRTRAQLCSSVTWMQNMHISSLSGTLVPTTSKISQLHKMQKMALASAVRASSKHMTVHSHSLSNVHALADKHACSLSVWTITYIQSIHMILSVGACFRPSSLVTCQVRWLGLVLLYPSKVQRSYLAAVRVVGAKMLLQEGAMQVGTQF